MNEVPLVVYPVGRTRLLAGALLGLWLIAALVSLGWLLAQVSDRASFIWRISLLITVLLACGFGLIFFWRAQISQRLVFDGGQWWLYGPDMTPQANHGEPVAVMLDAWGGMLLRWPGVGHGLNSQAKWLWAEATSVPSRWHLLRCALYSPANRPVAEVSGDPTQP
ncbi:hypothetical protein [Ottowia thiooxydans]|uniref:Uncharacterized protein n=1 Tax=Ottowia thiooxydans TaxID=219182 RepID=A0ABV2Q5N3_9BURK